MDHLVYNLQLTPRWQTALLRDAAGSREFQAIVLHIAWKDEWMGRTLENMRTVNC